MFSQRAALHRARKYSREFFEGFVRDLQSAGFESVDILLPHNVAGMADSIISVDELLRRERNYPSLILRARATARNETLKVLFINVNSRAVFIDDTFPNGQSEPPQVYVQSPDPARLHGLFSYFQEYLQRPSLFSAGMLTLGGGISTLFLWAEFLTLVTRGRGTLAAAYGFSHGWDLFVSVLAGYLILKNNAAPTGLWIKPKRELRLLYLANAALRGEFRDNPLLALGVAVVATVVGAIVVRWLHLI